MDNVVEILLGTYFFGLLFTSYLSFRGLWNNPTTLRRFLDSPWFTIGSCVLWPLVIILGSLVLGIGYLRGKTVEKMERRYHDLMAKEMEKDHPGSGVSNAD